MAEDETTKTPAAADEQPGKSPDAGEGKSPDGEQQPAAEEPQGRTYSEAYVKQLRNEAAKHRNRIEELEESIQERADADKTELEKLNDRAASAEKKAEDASTRLLRYEVASEHGLDMSAAAFLTGATREEIELRAEELGKLLQDKAKPTTAGFDGGARTTAQEKKSPEEEHNDFLLRTLGRQRAT